MPDDRGNGDWLPKPLRLFLWISTSVVVLLLLGLVLFNPGNALGSDRIVTFGWFQTYPGQSSALQLLGTFIAAMGAMASLIERRLTGKVPLALSIPAIAGAGAVITGLAVQDIPDSYLASAVLGALWVSVAPIWILAAAWAVKTWFSEWLKSRRKPGN